MKNPPIMIAILGFFAALAGFSFLFFGLQVLGFDWFGVLGDLPAFENAGLWGWLAIATGIVWLLAAFGLWALQPWARLFALIMAGFGLFEAVLAFVQFPGTGVAFGMALLPGLILWYLTTSEVKAAFGIEPVASAPAQAQVAPPPAPPAAAAPAESVSVPAPVAVAAAAAVAAEATAPEPAPIEAAPVPAAAVIAASEAVAPESAPIEAAPVAAPATAPVAAAPERRMRIDDVEGIGPAYAEKLAAAGIVTTDDLLAAGATRDGREKLAEATGISDKLILEWVNNADLMRVPGVGTQYSDLLEAAGVDSPAELAHRNAANLARTFQEVVAARPGTVRRIPTEAEVAGWIEEAAKLPKVVEH